MTAYHIVLYFVLIRHTKMTVIQNWALTPATAQQLLQASKDLSWSRLSPFISKLADRTISGENGFSVYQLVEAFEALNLLLGKMYLCMLQSKFDHRLMSDGRMPVSLALLWALQYCHHMLQLPHMLSMNGACHYPRHHYWCGGQRTPSCKSWKTACLVVMFMQQISCVSMACKTSGALCNDEAARIVRHDLTNMLMPKYRLCMYIGHHQCKPGCKT